MYQGQGAMSGTCMFPFVITTINEATSVAAAAGTFASGPPQTCFVAVASASQAAEGGRITWGAF